MTTPVSPQPVATDKSVNQLTSNIAKLNTNSAPAESQKPATEAQKPAVVAETKPAAAEKPVPPKAVVPEGERSVTACSVSAFQDLYA